MRQKSGPEKQPAEDTIKDIRRTTRRRFSTEEKIRVVDVQDIGFGHLDGP